jgi:dTDP-4-amino-4,6-dideoxy-D-galactose acyltransferase
MPDTGLCEFLPWDSSFFGVRIARLLPRRLSPGSLAQALEWCGSNRIRCLYFLADPEHKETAQLARAASFDLVDVRVELAHMTGPAEPAAAAVGRIRLYRQDDLEFLKAIARRSHSDSRFFFDGHFPKERAEALFEAWIERSCRGWAQAVFVAEIDRTAVGYTTCHIDREDSGSIGLVGLAPQAQGRGLGTQLVRTAVSYFHREGVAKILVVTQGRNDRAQRLYRKCGFATDSVMHWYHRWTA